MATYELTAPDGSTYDLEAPDDAPPEVIRQKAEAAKAAIAQPSAPQPEVSSSTTSTPTSQPGLIERATAPTRRAVTERVIDPMMGAAGRLLEFPGKQMSTPMGVGGAVKELGKTGLDIGTLVAPFLAPGLTALGVGVQSGAEHLGMGHDNASRLGTAVELLTPFTKLARAGTRRGMARQATQAADDALGGETFASASARTQERIPRGLRWRKGDVGNLYRDVRTEAQAVGAGFDPASPATQRLAAVTADVKSVLGDDLPAKAAAKLATIEEAVATQQRIPYEVVDDLNQELGNIIPPAAKYGPQWQRQMRRVKGALSRMLPEADGIKGTPVADTLREANKRWATEVGPFEGMGRFAETPGRTAIETGRKMLSISDAERVTKVGELTMDSAGTAQGVLARLIEGTPKTADGYVDAVKLSQKLHNLSPEMQQVIGLKKNGAAANTLLKTLARVQPGGNMLVSAAKEGGGTAAGAAALKLAGVSLPGGMAAIPLAGALGATPRFLALLTRGLRTPVGSRQAAKLGALIAKESEGLRAD